MDVAAQERFFRKVTQEGMDPLGGCWLWTGDIRAGYGQFWLDGKNRRAHRVSWELFNGPVPEGLQLDHLCRVRNCVNHLHLDPVTPVVNTRRARNRGVCERELHPRPDGEACKPCRNTRQEEWRRERMQDPAYRDRINEKQRINYAKRRQRRLAEAAIREALGVDDER